MAAGRVIGLQGRMPWHLPADLRRFRAVTWGKPVVMGRVTHESIGHPLPGRTNIVMTRAADYRAAGCVVVASPEQALAAAEGAAECMVIGGAQLYAEFLPRAQRLYLTFIEARVDGDAFFPPYPGTEWCEAACERHAADAENPYSYRFVVAERVTPLVIS